MSRAQSPESITEDRSTLIADIQRLLSSDENVSYAKYCHDILNDSLDPNQLNLAFHALNDFMLAAELNYCMGAQEPASHRNRLFYRFPQDEAYLLIKRVLTFARSENEPEIEVMSM